MQELGLIFYDSDLVHRLAGPHSGLFYGDTAILCQHPEDKVLELSMRRLTKVGRELFELTAPTVKEAYLRHVIERLKSFGVEVFTGPASAISGNVIKEDVFIKQ
jgi:hypothetical protein